MVTWILLNLVNSPLLTLPAGLSLPSLEDPEDVPEVVIIDPESSEEVTEEPSEELTEESSEEITEESSEEKTEEVTEYTSEIVVYADPEAPELPAGYSPQLDALIWIGIIIVVCIFTSWIWKAFNRAFPDF